MLAQSNQFLGNNYLQSLEMLQKKLNQKNEISQLIEQGLEKVDQQFLILFILHNKKYKIAKIMNESKGLNRDIYTDETMCGSDVLYEVKELEMKERLHKFMVAIVWKMNKYHVSLVGRGSGILISPNLILTVAHNLFYQMERVQIQHFQLFIGHSGKLKRPYKIEKTFIPSEYDPKSMLKHQLAVFDYALIKITQRIEAHNFIELGVNYNINKQKLAVFGYPGSKYYNTDKQSNLQAINQWGLIKQHSVAQIRLQRGQVLHCVSTLQGHSGSPILLVQDLKQEKLTIVGIHKGGIKTQINGHKVAINAGKLLTEELMVILLEESLRMGAEKFLIQQKEKIACNLVNIGDKLLQKSKAQFIKIIELYLNAFKINPDYLLQGKPKLMPFIQGFPDKQILIDYYMNQLKNGQKQFNANLLLGLIFQTKQEKQLEFKFKSQAVKANQCLQIGWSQLAFYYYEQRQYRQAIDCYNRTIKINPRHSIAYSNLGRIFFDVNKIEESIKYCQKAIQINKKNSQAFSNLGDIFYAINKMEESINFYQKAIQIKPQDSIIYCNLGNAFKDFNKIKDAIRYYCKAIEINSGCSLAYNNLGDAYQQMKDMESAIDYYYKALQKDKNDQLYNANFNRALEYFRKKDIIPKGFERYFV